MHSHVIENLETYLDEEGFRIPSNITSVIVQYKKSIRCYSAHFILMELENGLQVPFSPRKLYRNELEQKKEMMENAA